MLLIDVVGGIRFVVRGQFNAITNARRKIPRERYFI
jgi:hypothetical protein